jgi:hypothetical protein
MTISITTRTTKNNANLREDDDLDNKEGCPPKQELKASAAVAVRSWHGGEALHVEDDCNSSQIADSVSQGFP